MFCSKCGASLVDGAEFCQKCGAQIKKREEAEPQPQVYAQPESVVEAPVRSKAPIIIAVCAAVAVVIIVAAIAIPAIMRHKQNVWEEKVENVLNEVKQCRPFDAEDGQERWQTSDTPTYAEVFEYAINPTWEVTDPNTKELKVDGVASYTNEEVHIYFNSESTMPYSIECGEHKFGYGDITTFINDMFDAYMNNEEFVPLTVPKFIGRINGNTYENKYFGIKLTLPQSNNGNWHFLGDEEIKEMGLPTKDDIYDLIHPSFGDYFVDVIAANGKADIGIHMEYISNYIDDFNTYDECLDAVVSGVIENLGETIGYLSCQIDDEYSFVGGVRFKSFLMEFNTEADGHHYTKFYYAIKDDMVFQIQILVLELSDIAKFESMFSPM